MSVPTPSEQRATKTLDAYDPSDKTAMYVGISGGVVFGVALPVGIVRSLSKEVWNARFPASGDRLMLAVASLPVCALVFFGHFMSAGRARGSSEDKSVAAYPAEASIVRAEPVALVRANRAFQNTIENFMVFLPSFLGASLHMTDARIIPAMAISWAASRIAYRIGYLSDNSLNRTVGMLPSTMLNVYLMGFGAYKFVGLLRQ